MKNKIKTMKIEEQFEREVSCLCKTLHTNFSNKTKELLLEWKIKEEKRLKKESPDLYNKYRDELNKK